MAVDRMAGIPGNASDRKPAMIVKAETTTGRPMNLRASSIEEWGVGSGEWGVGTESGVGSGEWGVGDKEITSPTPIPDSLFPTTHSPPPTPRSRFLHPHSPRPTPREEIPI